MKRHRIEFPGTRFAPVDLSEGAELARSLSVNNSPLLFGCRSGLCGTCLVAVEADEALPPPDDAEAEALAIYAPGNPQARLACQVVLSTGLRIRKLREA